MRPRRPSRAGARLAALHVGAVALLYPVLEIVLFKLHRHAVWPLAGWLLALLVTVAAIVAMARSAARISESRLVAWWARRDVPEIVLLGFVFLLVVVFHLTFQRAASDGREYFVQVRSLVMDHDLDFANENEVFGVRGSAHLLPLGSALLWIPFHAGVHLWQVAGNALGGSFVTDGYANPYQQAVGLGTLVYGGLALWMILTLLRDYYSDRLALFATVLTCCGTFLVWYLVTESTMSHGPSMFATTLFLFVFHRTRDRSPEARRQPASRTPGQWIGLGLAGGLMTMVRWQNGLFMLAPLLEAGVDHLRLARRGAWRGVGGLLGRHLAFLAAVAVGFSPQLLLWAATAGGGSSADALVAPGLSATRVASPAVLDVLFAADHGLFSWTPLVYLAVLALPFFVGKDRLLGVVLVACFLGQLAVNSLASGVSGGAGFGARRFSNCALVFAVGLACACDGLRRRPRALLGAGLSVLLVANVFFMLDVKSRRLRAGGGITFDQVLLGQYRRVGNPFSFPASLLFARAYETGLVAYDRSFAHRYNNLVIDLGEEGDEAFLNRGWADPKQGPEESFRWAVGPQSDLIVTLRGENDYELRFRAAAFTFPGSGQQTLSVWLGDERLAEVAIDAVMRDYEVDIPARLLPGRGVARVRFVPAYSRSPQELGLSRDGRELSARFDTIAFHRRSYENPLYLHRHEADGGAGR